MRWQDWFAGSLIIVAAGLQSSISTIGHYGALLDFPLVGVALLSTYPRINVWALMIALTLTRIVIGTESIPVTMFRSFVATFFSIKAGLRLMNHGWLLAIVTVTTCVIFDHFATVIVHPKYVTTIDLTDIVSSVVFNAGITLICAVPIEIYYRKKHMFGF